MDRKKEHTAQEIAKMVPHCPNCGSGKYYSLTENASAAFRLKSLRCEVCQHDILAEARQIEQARRDPASAPAWLAALLFFIVLEILALTGLLWK